MIVLCNLPLLPPVSRPSVKGQAVDILVTDKVILADCLQLVSQPSLTSINIFSLGYLREIPRDCCNIGPSVSVLWHHPEHLRHSFFCPYVYVLPKAKSSTV